MWTALSGVVPGVSVGSVQANAERPFFARREAIADLSSPMCTAFSTVVCATRGLSVKPPEELVEKLAVTACAALIVTTQVPVPAQPPPLQALKVEPVVGAAVRVTTVPVGEEVEQGAPQEMPAGQRGTVPP